MNEKWTGNITLSTSGRQKGFQFFFFSFHFVSPCQKMPTIWKREKKTFDNIILYLFRFISIHSIVVNFLCHSKNMSIQQFCTIQVHNLSYSLCIRPDVWDWLWIYCFFGKEKSQFSLHFQQKHRVKRNKKKWNKTIKSRFQYEREKRSLFKGFFFSLVILFYIYFPFAYFEWHRLLQLMSHLLYAFVCYFSRLRCFCFHNDNTLKSKQNHTPKSQRHSSVGSWIKIFHSSLSLGNGMNHAGRKYWIVFFFKCVSGICDSVGSWWLVHVTHYRTNHIHIKLWFKS